MKMRLIIKFFLIVLVCGCQEKKQQEQQIIFGMKTYYDNAKTVEPGLVFITGTLTGEDVFNKNNAISITCFEDRRECLTFKVDQIGPNQIGRLDMPDSYSIVKWNDYEVVATGAGDWVNCSKITISITRSTQSALWVIQPINQTQSQCAKSNTKILKWTVENPPSWQALQGSK